MEPRTRHWLAAALIALLLHAGLALAVLWQTPQSGAREAGAGGLQAGMGSPGGAPETAATAAPASMTAEAPDSATAAAPAENATTEDAPSADAVEVPSSQAEEPEIASSEATEPTQAEQPESETADTAEPETSESVEPTETQAEDAEPETAETAEPEVAESAEADSEATPDSPDTSQSAEDAEEAERAETAASADGDSDDSGSGQATGSGSDSSAGGRPGATQDYQDELRAWLQRHKEYPRRARMRRQEGTVVLRFTVARDGEVLDYTIEERSGHSALDDEVERMIRRAQPLPSMPDDMDRDRMTLTIPVQFSLR